MACEARIIRVLRALEYPTLATLAGTTSTTLDNRLDELARIVSWLEDRKIRHRAIADREPLRTAGPHWDEAFFTYLREMDCPYDLKPVATGAGGEGQAEASSSRLRGLSWLVAEAAAEEFAEHGQEYAEAAKKILAQSHSVQVEQAAKSRPASASPPPPPGASVEVLQGKSAAPAAATATRLDVSPSSVLAPAGEDKKRNGSDGLDHREEKKGDDKDGVDHAGGRVSRCNTAVSMEQDGGAEDGQGDGDRVFDELEGFSAGVDTGDETCNRVATVLRMLYLSDLRTLQDEVNGVLAMAQTGGP